MTVDLILYRSNVTLKVLLPLQNNFFLNFQCSRGSWSWFRYARRLENQSIDLDYKHFISGGHFYFIIASWMLNNIFEMSNQQHKSSSYCSLLMVFMHDSQHLRFSISKVYTKTILWVLFNIIWHETVEKGNLHQRTEEEVEIWSMLRFHLDENKT